MPLHSVTVRRTVRIVRRPVRIRIRITRRIR